jgi:hypothetical protein
MIPLSTHLFYHWSIPLIQMFWLPVYQQYGINGKNYEYIIHEISVTWQIRFCSALMYDYESKHHSVIFHNLFFLNQNH